MKGAIILVKMFIFHGNYEQMKTNISKNHKVRFFSWKQHISFGQSEISWVSMSMGQTKIIISLHTKTHTWFEAILWVASFSSILSITIGLPRLSLNMPELNLTYLWCPCITWGYIHANIIRISLLSLRNI